MCLKVVQHWPDVPHGVCTLKVIRDINFKQIMEGNERLGSTKLNYVKCVMYVCFHDLY